MHLRSWAEWPLVHIGHLPRPSSHDSLQWVRQEQVRRSGHTLATQNNNLFSMSYLENNPVKDILATLTSRGSCVLCCQPNGIFRIWYKPWKVLISLDTTWFRVGTPLYAWRIQPQQGLLFAARRPRSRVFCLRYLTSPIYLFSFKLAPPTALIMLFPCIDHSRRVHHHLSFILQAVLTTIVPLILPPI